MRERLVVGRLGAAAIAALIVGCSGDGPQLTPVEGTVTLNGQPLAGAIVTFTPKAGGRPSGGQTDEEGWYELIYSRDATGALPGEHAVTITTHQEGDRGQDIPAVAEKLPAKYNTKSELVKTVEPDDNVIDFALDSEGVVVQPSMDR